jgi:single-stranded DNA-binding protein
VATTPRFILTEAFEALANFRLATWDTEYDTKTLVWYSVVARGALAYKVQDWVKKGDEILVQGDLVIRQWEHDTTRASGSTAELTARVIGHDISWKYADYADYGKKTNLEPEEMFS